MTPKDWESSIDQQIREAMERGDFDKLPGKGKPLDLANNPYAGDKEMAFKLLKDAGYAPEWIEMDKAIRKRIERAVATLTRQWQGYQARLGQLEGCTDSWAQAEKQRGLAGWQQAVAAFSDEVTAINKEIADLNLKVPLPSLQRPKIDAGREVARVEAGTA